MCAARARTGVGVDRAVPPDGVRGMPARQPSPVPGGPHWSQFCGGLDVQIQKTWSPCTEW